jgi:hypothetical protein
MGQEIVRFSGAKISMVGVIAGVIIALGVPYVVLTHGQFLGPTIVTIILLTALLIGGGIALTAAFFGAVIPTVVQDNGTQKSTVSDESKTFENKI